MRDVPKFVLKRLEENAGGEAHPDADLLTGFVEKSLLESERKQVTEHLARCSACRETVALALPASEDGVAEDVASIISARPARSRWFSWAAVGWVGATVAIVGITFVGIREYRLRSNDASKLDTSKQILLSQNEKSLAPAYPTISAPQASSAPSQIAPQEKNGEGANSPRMTQPNRQEHFSISPLNRLSKQPPSPHAGQVHAAAGRAASVASGAAGVQSARAPDAAQSSDQRSNVGKETAVPPASQTVEVETEDAVVPASPGKKDSGKSVDKKEAVGDQSSKKLTAAIAPPQWSIGADGALQRSLDAGQTWVNVDPAQESVQSSEAEITENARAFNKSGAKKSAQKKGSATKSDERSNPVFRAVAAFGNEVWAGGSAGTLYHSSDSGDHWTRIVPFASGAMLSGDISSIDFSDPQNGMITTSTGEVWLTADAGRTWRR